MKHQSQRFESLEIWKESITYGVEVYKLTTSFPKSEIFGIVSQLRRAAVSISSNIAEGSGASSKKDFMKFLDIAVKSTLETLSQLRFAQEIRFVTQEDVGPLVDDATMLIRRIRAFKNSLNKRT